MISSASILAGFSLISCIAAQSAYDILATYCPCAQRVICPRFFGENDDVISRQILAVLPPCQSSEVRCCQRESMFRAIDNILGSGTGRSLSGVAGSPAVGPGRPGTISGRSLGFDQLSGRQLAGDQLSLTGRTGLHGFVQPSNGQGLVGIQQQGLGGRSLDSFLTGRTLDTTGQFNLQGRNLGVDSLTLPRVAAPVTTLQGPQPAVSLPRQLPGPVAPSVSIVGPSPVYISEDVVQGPSDQGNGGAGPGFIGGRSGDLRSGTLTPEARTLINLLKERLVGSTAGRTIFK